MSSSAECCAQSHRPTAERYIVLQVLYLYSLSQMLVQMKRQELQHKARHRAKQELLTDAKKMT